MKFIKENIPLITAILIFLGYWNLTLYYDYFNIDIYQYISTSEIILSFLPLLKSTLFITIIVATCFVVIFGKSIFGSTNRPKSQFDNLDLYKDDWKFLKMIRELFSRRTYQKTFLKNIFKKHFYFCIPTFILYSSIKLYNLSYRRSCANNLWSH